MAKAPSKFPFEEVDDFQLQELIYEGPHTLVFRGHQSNLNRPVLIKLLKPLIEERKEYIERFQREARVCAKLKHPNIVSVYKLGEKHSYHYIALEFVEGISLKELLSNTAHLPFSITLSITNDILEALIYVNQNKIIHRDIKPGNIMIDLNGQAKLTDFGLAHLGEEISVTQQGSIIGTPAYMAPEQILGGVLDGKTDLFSLGTVIYEMLTGKQAFDGENYSACLHKIVNEEPQRPSQINSQLPENVNSFVEKFLKKNPEERWKDSQQAQEDLLQLANRNEIKLERTSIQRLIQPFLSANLSEAKQTQSTAAHEQHPQNANDTMKGRFGGRGKIIGILAAVIIILSTTFIWMNNRDESRPSTADSQDNVNSALSDSGKSKFQTAMPSDSITLPKRVSNAEIKRNDQISDQNTHKQKSSSVQTKGSANDTLIAENTITKPANNKEPTSIENYTIAHLNIAVEPWAKIKVDEQEVDSQTHRIRIPVSPGKHTLTFLHPNFSPYAMPIEIQPGEEKTVRWSFLENAGFLWIEVRPWGEIYIDNQYRDSTPLENAIILSSGRHLLELKHPKLQSYRDYINIVPKDTLRLQIVLNKE